MKVGFMIPVRNKVEHLERSVGGAFSQTYSPLDIILSDQGSTDGSLEKLKELKASYNGPHRVSILQCPDTEFTGIAGFNAHLNWLHMNTDHDIVISCSADDWSYSGRTETCVRAFEEFNPSMVLNSLFFVEPDGKIKGQTAYPQEDGFVKVEDCLPRMVGGSTIASWRADFFQKIFPLMSITIPDVYMAHLACLDDGAYYTTRPLHTYIRHVDENNSGLEGRFRAAQDVGAKLQIEELMHFQTSYTYMEILKTMERNGWDTDKRNQYPVWEQMLGRAVSWSNCRHNLTIGKHDPIQMRVFA